MHTTNPTAEANPSASPSNSEQELLQHLLQQSSFAKPPIHGVVVGRVLALRTDNKLDIALDTLGIAHAIASPLCAPNTLLPGVAVAVMFKQGNTDHPLILGAMHNGLAQEGDNKPANSAPELSIAKQRIVISAEQEIELRCGDAAIVLTADGRILLNGTYISSHASASQRIVGGAVQIN